MSILRQGSTRKKRIIFWLKKMGVGLLKNTSISLEQKWKELDRAWHHQGLWPVITWHSPPFLLSFLLNAKAPLNALSCSQNLPFFTFFDHLRVPELIIKGVEGLNLVSDEELFIDTVNRTENVAFAERLATILPDRVQGALKQLCQISSGHCLIF